MPDLDETLKKYLRCLEPIQSQEEFEKTKILVENFRNSTDIGGPHLQQMLLDRVKDSENYVRQIANVEFLS